MHYVHVWKYCTGYYYMPQLHCIKRVVHEVDKYLATLQPLAQLLCLIWEQSTTLYIIHEIFHTEKFSWYYVFPL
jgi:hypothetical protein